MNFAPKIEFQWGGGESPLPIVRFNLWAASSFFLVVRARLCRIQVALFSIKEFCFLPEFSERKFFHSEFFGYGCGYAVLSGSSIPEWASCLVVHEIRRAVICERYSSALNGF